MHSAARKLPPRYHGYARASRATVAQLWRASSDAFLSTLADDHRRELEPRLDRYKPRTHRRVCAQAQITSSKPCSSSRPSPSPPPRPRSSRPSRRRPRSPSRARRSTTSSRRSRASRRSRTPRPTTALIRSALPRSPTPASACRKMNCSARTTCATPSYAMVASRCSPRPRGRSRNSRTRRWPSSRARRSFCRTAARPRSSTEASSRAPCRRSC
jgi:hypothetical protein